MFQYFFSTSHSCILVLLLFSLEPEIPDINSEEGSQEDIKPDPTTTTNEQPGGETGEGWCNCS